MGQKQVKRYRRITKRYIGRQFEALMREMRERPYRERVGFALYVVGYAAPVAFGLGLAACAVAYTLLLLGHPWAWPAGGVGVASAVMYALARQDVIKL